MEKILRLFSHTLSAVATGCAAGYISFMLIRDWNKLMALEWRVDSSQVIPFFVTYSLTLLLAVFGWDLLLSRFTKIEDRRNHLKYYVYTLLLRRLPVPLTYLFGRVYFYKQEGVHKSVVLMASLLEWILLILSSAIVCLFVLPFWLTSQISIAIWLVAGALGVGGLLIHPRVIQTLFRILIKERPQFALQCSDIAIWLVIYSLVWIGGGLTLYIAINSLYPLPLTYLPTVIGMWAISGLITTLITTYSVGFGLKELTLGLLLGCILPNPTAIIIALLMRICLILCEIIWGIALLFLSQLPKRGIA